VPTFRLNDLLKNHTDFSDSSLSTTTFVLAVNKAAYERLPRDLKTVLDNNSGQVAAAMAGAMWDAQAAAVADMVVQRGDPIVTLLPEAVAHWRKAAQPVVEAWLKEMKEQKADGGKLIASAHALLVKYADAPEPQASQPAAPSQREAVAPPQPEAKNPTFSNVNAPTAARPAPTATPAPVAKPAAPAAPAPHVATQAPMPRPTLPVTASAPVPAPAAPVVKPIPAPATPAPVAAAPTPAPPVPKPMPAAASPPKTLDIPL
jgi:hypothetical protein